jgi:hypothetical protein
MVHILSAPTPIDADQMSPIRAADPLNLSVFWTLVIVVLGGPLLAFVLFWGMVLIALMLGYDPEI